MYLYNGQVIDGTKPRLEIIFNFRRYFTSPYYKGADKSLAPPGRKQTTATEDFELHISYL